MIYETPNDKLDLVNFERFTAKKNKTKQKRIHFYTSLKMPAPYYVKFVMLFRRPGVGPRKCCSQLDSHSDFSLMSDY